MTKSIWWFIGNPEGPWKSHLFPDAIKDRLLKNLEQRGMDIHPAHPKFALKTVTKLGIDAGGVCRSDEHWIEYQLDGAVFTLPVTQVDIYLDMLQTTLERLELGTPYYKLHGAWFCVCLMPKDRTELLKQMTQRLPEAQALVELENQKWNKFVDKAKEENAAILVEKKPVKEIERVWVLISTTKGY